MNSMIIMAGGTGGHVYVALAVANALRQKGVSVIWLGVKGGFEDQLAQKNGFEFDSISMRKVWGISTLRWLTAPIWTMISMFQSIVIILRRRPDAMLGVGGYVSAPAGLACWMMRRPLLIHESNAIPGLANRILAALSSYVLVGFPETELKGKPIFVGNPVRKEIIEAASDRSEFNPDREDQLRLLIIGGSQGARALNQNVPKAVARLEQKIRPKVMHQTGRGQRATAATAYSESGVEANLVEYIEDMAEAYCWADIVISRAGAMSVAELAAMGMPSILVPYPYAAKDHQRFNAEYFETRNCAYLVDERDPFPTRLEEKLRSFIENRQLINTMSKKIKQLATINATDMIVEHCMEAIKS